ncbi:MAG TPA: M10 family metallopeptidase C-terminal domain-containing protein [Ramlibacter sp.]|nr:M10 family metallopeptidase C-terminal domain-containing protein [Ramlibacter sp.]
MALAAAAQGGATPGSYATTPTDNSYHFVAQAQAPLQASGGDIATLIAGSKWASLDAASGKTVITYSFASPQTSTFSYTNSDFQASLSQFSGADQQLTRQVLARIEAVANVQFVEVPDNATEVGVLRYGYSQQPNAMNFAGYAFFPSSTAIGGDIWIGAAQASSQWDFYRADLVLHETLHALGLKHPFDSGAVLPTGQDIIPNTVMSYSPVAGGTSGFMSDYPVEPMALDIAALQYLYGASALNAGDTIYDLSSASYQDGFHAVWDAGGNNTFDASRIARGVTLNLNEGAHSDIGAKVSASALVNGANVDTTYTQTLTVAAGTVIQHAVGSGYDDVLIGNGASNWLYGGAGNDTLDGRDGNDFLVGGAGNNTLVGGAGVDTAIYAGGRAACSVQRAAGGSVTVSGAAGTDSLSGIERVWFSDGRLALDLDGNAGKVAKILGAVFGPASVHEQVYVGIGLNLLDGGMSYKDLIQLAIDFRLGADASNAQLVDLLHSNVAGWPPSAAERADYVAQLDNGTYSHESLTEMVAESELNQSHIDLVGLAATGIEYS